MRRFKESRCASSSKHRIPQSPGDSVTPSSDVITVATILPIFSSPSNVPARIISRSVVVACVAGSGEHGCVQCLLVQDPADAIDHDPAGRLQQPWASRVVAGPDLLFPPHVEAGDTAPP